MLREALSSVTRVHFFFVCVEMHIFWVRVAHFAMILFDGFFVTDISECSTLLLLRFLRERDIVYSVGWLWSLL